MTDHGQGPRRTRGGEAARHGTRSLAARWRVASPRPDALAAEPPGAPQGGAGMRGGRGDEGADFVRRAIQGLFQ